MVTATLCDESAARPVERCMGLGIRSMDSMHPRCSKNMTGLSSSMLGYQQSLGVVVASTHDHREPGRGANQHASSGSLRALHPTASRLSCGPASAPWIAQPNL